MPLDYVLHNRTPARYRNRFLAEAMVQLRIKLPLQGRFLDENYSRTLLAHVDLPWPDVLALDKVQKGTLPDEAIVQNLRRQRLVEGRKPFGSDHELFQNQRAL